MHQELIALVLARGAADGPIQSVDSRVGLGQRLASLGDVDASELENLCIRDVHQIVLIAFRGAIDCVQRVARISSRHLGHRVKLVLLNYVIDQLLLQIIRL